MSGEERYRGLPQVGQLLQSPDLAEAIAAFGRPRVLQAAREVLAEARAEIGRGRPKTVDVAEILARLLRAPRLRRVINATGVVLHTNLGRAPLAEEAIRAIETIARGYSNLEIDLVSGRRGSRHAVVEADLIALLEAEDAMVVNNCAAAVLLLLAATAAGREVIVARGELVEIGGGFRIPEILAASGARLVEVGATNKVHAEDYRRAIRPETAAILKVHRSNFAQIGFVKDTGLPELVPIAEAAGIPIFADVGSGLLAELPFPEPRPAASLREGAAVVAFSGDKLLGGPQAGILAGEREWISKLKRHPLARAVRIDKLSLAALAETLGLYRAERSARIPVLRALTADLGELEAKANEIRAHLKELRPGLKTAIVRGESKVGGGCLPLARPKTRLLLIGEGPNTRRRAECLRGGDPPLIARIVKNRLALDPRTLLAEDAAEVAALIIRAEDAVERLYSEE